MRYMMVLGCAFVLAGCVTQPFDIRPDYGNTEQLNFPALGVLEVANLGDSLAKKGYVTTKPGLKIYEKWEWWPRTAFHPEHWIEANAESLHKANVYVKKQKKLYECYYFDTPYAAHLNWYNKTGVSKVYVCEDDAGLAPLGRVANIDKSQPYMTVPFEKINQVDVSKPSYVQELLYNGRVGNALKFIYREFSGNYIKPAFTQEIQYDLTISDEIGFKDLVMRVESATNTEIKYTLISNF